jgi:lipoyl(octanoyl) transferase
MKDIQLKILPGLLHYRDTVDEMEMIVERIIQKKQGSELWFLEYNHVYTAGTASDPVSIKNQNIEIIQTNRGGKHTYHGPGQRVVYFITDLHDIFGESPDLREYISMLENWVILSLEEIGIEGSKSEINRGVWCGNNKIAAIGVRLKKWVTYHGFAINISTDLSCYENFIPCGINEPEYGITSINKELGKQYFMRNFDSVLLNNFNKVFDFKICY